MMMIINVNISPSNRHHSLCNSRKLMETLLGKYVKVFFFVSCVLSALASWLLLSELLHQPPSLREAGTVCWLCNLSKCHLRPLSFQSVFSALSPLVNKRNENKRSEVVMPVCLSLSLCSNVLFFYISQIFWVIWMFCVPFKTRWEVVVCWGVFSLKLNVL